MPDSLPVFIDLGTIVPLFRWTEFPNFSTNGGVYRLHFTPNNPDEEVENDFHLLLRRKWADKVVERSEFFYPKDETILFSSLPDLFWVQYYGNPKWEAMLGYRRYFKGINFKITLEEIEFDPYLHDGEVVAP
ncbi:MAG: hypothetical protein AAGA60_10745 [Cyanobacteria bacterium P01_E01_bin.42]